jgi:hypothetical protein
MGDVFTFFFIKGAEARFPLEVTIMCKVPSATPPLHNPPQPQLRDQKKRETFLLGSSKKEKPSVIKSCNLSKYVVCMYLDIFQAVDICNFFEVDICKFKQS